MMRDNAYLLVFFGFIALLLVAEVVGLIAAFGESFMFGVVAVILPPVAIIYGLITIF